MVIDCRALYATFANRDVLPRVAGWIQLQEFDCSIEYRARRPHADALSRNRNTKLIMESKM